MSLREAKRPSGQPGGFHCGTFALTRFGMSFGRPDGADATSPALSSLRRAAPAAPVADSRRGRERPPTMRGVTDAPTEMLRHCPQCAQAMAHLSLQ
ncbi:MAG TPA: hypothetical protein VFZ28_11745, partial [Burkholderiaceae bacterium]|nr:hypothetical protein [Burkholderiaceae bacterium]